MRSIVILGAGELGGALARQIAAADFVHRVTMVDGARTIAEGKALDITEAAPIDGYSTSVRGTDDESATVDADGVILADQADSAGDEWHGDGGLALLGRVAYLNPVPSFFARALARWTLSNVASASSAFAVSACLGRRLRVCAPLSCR